ncbi:hypothetical protein OG206_14665 [Streptomyces sp. NBC_01341]|nr:hypothetical protein OG206_14665 [Streptomyces sp. NBC_01341]
MSSGSCPAVLGPLDQRGEALLGPAAFLGVLGVVGELGVGRGHL